MTLATVRALGRSGRPGGRPAPVTAAHPFAEFLRTIGRGATLGRPLDETEAEQAMGMILDGAVEPVQLGAFLLVLRYRTETPAELAGFVRAARVRSVATGRHRGRPRLAVLRRPAQAAALFRARGAAAGRTWRARADARHRRRGGRHHPCSFARARCPGLRLGGRGCDRIGACGFAYLPLCVICPELEALFQLRPLLGLRSPVNSVARELNPFQAPHQIQGVFHPTYLPLHGETAQRLGQAHAVIFKGGGGEGPAQPGQALPRGDRRCGVMGEAIWPALSDGEPHPWRRDPLEPERLAGLWRGEWEAPGPIAAVVGTAAMALKLLGRAAGIEDAEEEARRLWRERPRRQFGAA